MVRSRCWLTLERMCLSAACGSLRTAGCPLQNLRVLRYSLRLHSAGHGILWDGYRNEDLERLIRDFYVADKTIATCSQGAVALLGVQVRTWRPPLHALVCVRRTSVRLSWGARRSQPSL